MKKILGVSMAAAIAILLTAATSYAAKRPHEGRVVRVETVEQSADVGGQTVANVLRDMVVQSEHGDQWTLYWDDTTNFKNGISPSSLREGDKVHFDFVERDGKMWLTEIRRTKRAD